MSIVIEEPPAAGGWYGPVIAVFVLLDLLLVAGHVRAEQPAPRPAFVSTQTGAVEGA